MEDPYEQPPQNNIPVEVEKKINPKINELEIPCEGCGDNLCDVKCLECNKYFCSQCNKIIHSVKLYQSHKLTQLGNNLNKTTYEEKTIDRQYQGPLETNIQPSTKPTTEIKQSTQQPLQKVESGMGIVLDQGSYMVKVGIGGEDAPREVFPTIVGRPKPNLSIQMKDCYIGDDAFAKRGILRLRRPIEHGNVVNWEDMESLWHHTFYNELKIDPEEHPILLSLKYNPENKNHPEKIAQIMFETFNVPAFYITQPELLSILASGRLTGTVVDIGGQQTTVDSFYQAASLPGSRTRLDMGGASITDYFLKILAERGYSFTTSAEREIVRDMKEKLCYTALDYKEEMRVASQSTRFEKNYELPDGQMILIGNERFRATETLLQPHLLGSSMPGLINTIYQSISSCDFNYRNNLYQNIILSGGSSMFQGLAQRIQKEISKLAPQKATVKVIAPPERKYSTWIGGSILASLSSFQQAWLTKENYNQEGVSIVHKPSNLQLM
ncbi:actin-7-related [Anaeramoeba flamelloides]|uniref:Actin-7-related n=1 Tax=Anaeramoeba flamelloides TaxID=1746091 RepID=A0AAV7Y3R0_9EUKA|nr:actin-7-related [Anaeramoeba flamelloides]